MGINRLMARSFFQRVRTIDFSLRNQKSERSRLRERLYSIIKDLRESVVPTVLKSGSYRFFFFSREETRVHIHVSCSDGEAKFWLLPQIELARNYKLSRVQLKEIERLIEDNYDDFKNAWNTYFQNRD